MTQTIVLTGGSNGIGAATLSRLADAGHTLFNLDVTACDRNDVGVTSITCDLADQQSISDAINHLPDTIDALVHVAGVAPGFSDDMTVMKVNFLGMRQLNEHLLPKINTDGRVVIVASSIGRDWQENLETVTVLLDTDSFEEAAAWLVANESRWQENSYKFSKQCAAAYTYRAAGLAHARGITVNCVNPGIVETRLSPWFRDLVGESRYNAINTHVGRSGEPADIAAVISFLLSSDARWINGVELQADGGYRAGIVGGWLPQT